MTRSQCLPMAISLGALSAALAACRHSTPVGLDAAPAAAVHPPANPEIQELIYDGGLKNGWQDWGWAPRQLATGAPAVVHFNDYGGWIISKPGLSGDYGGVTFQVKEPPGEGEFLEVHVQNPHKTDFPRVKVSPDHCTTLSDGWVRVTIPAAELDPGGAPFDGIVLQAFRPVGSEPATSIDKVALYKGAMKPSPSAYDPSTLRAVQVAVDCRQKSARISPLVYGIAYYAFRDAKQQAAQWTLGATARRWGGNTTSTYNWELSAWNTGSDWFFENHDVPSYTQFLSDNEAHGIASALTVPMIGWVAKDTTSSSFAVSTFGAQEATDQYRPEAGNGKEKGTGKALRPGPPTLAYVAITPAYVKRWVQAIRAKDPGKRRVAMYILDNEPALWSVGHRDAHPDPLSYDELVQRTIDYGTAIREADPDAVIAGPAEWGWTGYMYSAKDLALGGPSVRLDRRAHGDVPVIAYYLKALADYEKRTGVRVLDVLDLHGYPYPDRVGGADTDVADVRIRSTRSMWDPKYVDESWVGEPVKLLPRMRAWIDENYPGRGMSIGEWNFGGEGHMSGALATAETLGRFAQFGVTSAFYWTYPPEGSPTSWAFRAYRNYDGKGAHFLDWLTPTTVTAGATDGGTPPPSVYVSRDDTGRHVVAIALNFSRKDAVSANLDLSACGKVASSVVRTYDGDPAGFVPGAPPSPSATGMGVALAPYSITVLDLQLDDPAPVAK